MGFPRFQRLKATVVEPVVLGIDRRIPNAYIPNVNSFISPTFPSRVDHNHFL